MTDLTVSKLGIYLQRRRARSRRARRFLVRNNRLRLISGSSLLLVNPTDGQETLTRATEVFRYIDSNFERWRCNVVGPPTEETAVRIYEIVRDSTLEEMFDSFGVNIGLLALTQAQIKQFAKRYPDWLKKGGNGTLFLFENGNERFVAAVYYFSDGRLGVRIRRLTLERSFRGEKRHRLVVKSF